MKKNEILEVLNSIEIMDFSNDDEGKLTSLLVEYTEETFDKIVSLGLNKEVLMNDHVVLDNNSNEYVIDLKMFVGRMVNSWDNESGFK